MKRLRIIGTLLMVVVLFALASCNPVGKPPAVQPPAGEPPALQILTADEYNDRGVDLFDQGKYEDAFKDFTSAIELDPDNAQFYVNRSIIYNSRGQYDLAIADCNDALELDSEVADAYIGRGFAYHYKGRLDLAIANYDKALELDPENALAWNNEGVILEELGKNEAALDCYNQALQINPSYGLAKSNRDSLIASMGEPETGSPAANAPEIVVPAVGKSVYDGIYIGMFTYEYQEYKYDKKEGRLVEGDWIADTLRLTVTFEHIGTASGMTTLVITKVICSDQNFGTGLVGITPTPFVSMALLPAEPPTTPMNPSQIGMGITITFPNGATLTTYNGLVGALNVSFDGRTISNSLDPDIQNRTWVATTPQGHFGTTSTDEAGTLIHFKSWSLSKSAL